MQTSLTSFQQAFGANALPPEKRPGGSLALWQQPITQPILSRTSSLPKNPVSWQTVHIKLSSGGNHKKPTALNSLKSVVVGLLCLFPLPLKATASPHSPYYSTPEQPQTLEYAPLAPQPTSVPFNPLSQPQTNYPPQPPSTLEFHPNQPPAQPSASPSTLEFRPNQPPAPSPPPPTTLPNHSSELEPANEGGSTSSFPFRAISLMTVLGACYLVNGLFKSGGTQSKSLALNTISPLSSDSSDKPEIIKFSSKTKEENSDSIQTFIEECINKENLSVLHLPAETLVNVPALEIFLVDSDGNQIRVRALFDTGATNVSVPKEVLKGLNYKVKETIKTGAVNSVGQNELTELSIVIPGLNKTGIPKLLRLQDIETIILPEKALDFDDAQGKAPLVLLGQTVMRRFKYILMENTQEPDGKLTNNFYLIY